AARRPGGAAAGGSRSVPGCGEVHVVLRRAAPASAPAPSDRAKGADDARRDHPGPVPRAVEIGPARAIAALAAAYVGVLYRVQIDGLAEGVLRPRACAASADARRGHGLPAFEGGAEVAVGGASPLRDRKSVG